MSLYSENYRATSLVGSRRKIKQKMKEWLTNLSWQRSVLARAWVSCQGSEQGAHGKWDVGVCKSACGLRLQCQPQTHGHRGEWYKLSFPSLPCSQTLHFSFTEKQGQIWGHNHRVRGPRLPTWQVNFETHPSRTLISWLLWHFILPELATAEQRMK